MTSVAATPLRRLVNEGRAAWAALIFFTRLPLPALPASQADDWRRAATYFPFAGWVVGAVAAGVWWAAATVFPPAIASGLSLAATILLTGAMHEDGFSDVCDGFGGGYTKEKILTIMQDSRVGAYALVGLVMALGLKWQTVAALDPVLTPWLLIVGHSVSRAASISIMATLDYARTEGKARPLASRLAWPRVLVAALLGLAPACVLPVSLLPALAAPLAVRFAASRYFQSRLGGYTGDCLGAAQLVAEIAFLLTALALQ